MRKLGLTLVLALVVGATLGFAGLATAGPTCDPSKGPALSDNEGTCFPTPAECATGDYNGVYDGGPDGRGAVCVGGDGQVVYYMGGNANTPCGTIIVADQPVAGSMDDDPNTCA